MNFSFNIGKWKNKAITNCYKGGEFEWTRKLEVGLIINNHIFISNFFKKIHICQALLNTHWLVENH